MGPPVRQPRITRAQYRTNLRRAQADLFLDQTAQPKQSTRFPAQKPLVKLMASRPALDSLRDGGEGGSAPIGIGGAPRGSLHTDRPPLLFLDRPRAPASAAPGSSPPRRNNSDGRLPILFFDEFLRPRPPAPRAPVSGAPGRARPARTSGTYRHVSALVLSGRRYLINARPRARSRVRLIPQERGRVPLRPLAVAPPRGGQAKAPVSPSAAHAKPPAVASWNRLAPAAVGLTGRRFVLSTSARARSRGPPYPRLSGAGPRSWRAPH